MNAQNAAPAFENPAAFITACEARGGAFLGQFPTEEDRRVLLASHELGLNGVPIVLLYLARSLRRLGWQPVLISPAAGPLLDTIQQESFPVLLCPSLLENDVLPRAAGLFRFVVLNTVLFAHAAAALSGTDATVLWWLHEAEEIYQNQYAQSMPPRLFSNISVYAVSQRSREHLLRHRPGYFAEVLPYGIPDAAETEAEPFPLSPEAKGKRVFALVGTVERRKGQDVLLDAVGLLPEDTARQCFFVFVGLVFHADIGDLVRMVATEQADRFQYIPQLPLEKMPAFYAAVDCVICASRDDPLPTTVAESCQLSKSVICSEHTGLAPLLEKDRAGFVYGGDDPAALAHCIEQVLGQGAEDAAAMHERARALYLSHFSPASFDRRLETEILPELLGPSMLNGRSDAQARLLCLAENGRQRLLHLEQLQKQELETMARLTLAQEQTIREQQAFIGQLADQSKTQEQTILEQQAHIGQLADQNKTQEQTIQEQQAHIGQLADQNKTQGQTILEQHANIGHLADQNKTQGQTILEQQAHIEQLEARNRYLEESFNIISNAFFWKITKPFRFTLDVLKWAVRPRAERGLIRKGLRSIRLYGLGVTWQKAKQRIYFSEPYTQVSKQSLFTEEELEEQRHRVFPQKIKFSVVVPLYNTPERFLRAMIESVQAQTYENWELCMADGSDSEHGGVEKICREYAKKDHRVRYRKLKKNLGISGNTNACLEMAEGDYIGLFDHDDLLHPAALHEVMRAICEKGADFIYTDESTFHDKPEDAYLPHFKPAFAPDTICGNNYICHFTVFSHSLLEKAGLFDPACDGAQDHDMVLRLTEKARHIVHIPEILYYWRAHAGSVAESTGVKPYVIDAGVNAVKNHLKRIGMEGEVSPVSPGMSFYRVRYAIKGTPKVSILIPNCEHLDDLKSCLNSIFSKTTWPNYEIVIVENNSSSPEVFDYYKKLQKERNNVRVVTWKGTFNYSAINNFGAKYCEGEYLLLLNNDVEVISPDWIQEMLMFTQRSDVGAAGAKLYYPDGTVQHAGVGLGIGGVAGHFHKYFQHDDFGYMARLIYAQDVSAVTGACMMIRRGVWEQLNGLDEEYAVAFNDVDLCMRIRQADYLIVWTPFAELYHYESKSRGMEDTPEKQRRFASEVTRFQQRWKKELEAGDPYFNPNFSLDREDFFVLPSVLPHDAR